MSLIHIKHYQQQLTLAGKREPFGEFFTNCFHSSLLTAEDISKKLSRTSSGLKSYRRQEKVPKSFDVFVEEKVVLAEMKLTD